MNFKNNLYIAKNIQEIFELVKKVCYDCLGKDQAGLLVGLSNLGIYENSFLGAFYSLNANTIVINRIPLFNIKQTKPEIYNSYVFYILLHEYLHSLGYLNETEVKKLTYEISLNYLGKDHLATKLASNIQAFLPYFLTTKTKVNLEDLSIDYLNGIDRKNTNYIM
jgi:hypothetical protein